MARKITRDDLQRKSAAEYLMARVLYRRGLFEAAADMQTTAAALAVRASMPDESPTKHKRKYRTKYHVLTRIERLERVIARTLETIDADLAEADELGYSHQSNNHIRALLEPLRAAVAQSQDQKSKRSQRRSHADADSSTSRS